MRAAHTRPDTWFAPDRGEITPNPSLAPQASSTHGGLRQVWALKKEGKGAVGLFEVSSPEELQSMVASFPMVQKDYVDHDVFPLGPFEAFAE